MSNGCHRRERAETFRRHNYVSHVAKGKLRANEATRFIGQLESYFQDLASRSPGHITPGRKYSFKVRGAQQELQVEMSGNLQNGSIVITGGHALYSEIHYSPRAIHVYRSHQEVGNYANEAAIYLNRRLPSESLGFGPQTQFSTLLNL